MLMLLHMFGGDGPPATVGPVDCSRLSAGDLQVGSPNEPLAAYREGAWCVGALCYSCVVCEGPAICDFQEGQPARPEHREGPFAKLSLIDGVLWGDDVALARLDVDNQVWRLVEDWSDYFRAIAWRAA